MVSKPLLIDRFGRTALHRAAIIGDLTESELKSAGDELERADIFGWTVFHAAAYGGCLDSFLSEDLTPKNLLRRNARGGETALALWLASGSEWPKDMTARHWKNASDLAELEGLRAHPLLDEERRTKICNFVGEVKNFISIKLEARHPDSFVICNISGPAASVR